MVGGKWLTARDYQAEAYRMLGDSQSLAYKNDDIVFQVQSLVRRRLTMAGMRA